MATRLTHSLRLLSIGVVLLLAVLLIAPASSTVEIGGWRPALNLGLDLQGGTHLTYRADTSEVPAEDVTQAMAGVRDVLERRINAFGVGEPVVQTNRAGSEERVLIELPGVHDPVEAIARLGETPQLDFRVEAAADELVGDVNQDTDEAHSPELVVPRFERTELTGRHLRRSSVDFNQVSGTPQVNLVFDGEGADLFAELTRSNIGRRIAIYLDGVPISAPVVQSEITNGQAVISGGFSLDEANQLAQRLNAGALPIPIELIGQQTVGPSLGQRSVQQSVVAGAIGLAAVMVWMVVFYRLPGLVAAGSLLFYLAVFMALLKVLPITLTLAGVAGIVLSVGMAVDANVLIFERIRDNIRRGRSVSYALAHGFEEAWRSIWAANVSSLLTAIILYGFGTSLIRGFAVTFALGVLLSMVSAIMITRALLQVALANPRTHAPWLLSATPRPGS